MLSYLVKRRRLASLDASGNLCWDVPQVKLLLDQCQRLWQNVFHMLVITLGISTRVSQFLRMQIRNADRQRNIYFRGAEMFFLSRDGKTSSIEGRDSCAPCFPPAQVSAFLLELLGGGLREAKAHLAGIIYGADATDVYCMYLCVFNGRRMEPEDFYDQFKDKNQELFDCAWGTRDFRQASISMARNYIAPNATFALLEDVLAESVDHSPETDRLHYGNAVGALPRLTHNQMEQQRWAAHEWHSLLGLGPYAVQEPIADARLRGPPAIRDALKSMMADMIPELSCTLAASLMNELWPVLTAALAIQQTEGERRPSPTAPLDASPASSSSPTETPQATAPISQMELLTASLGTASAAPLVSGTTLAASP
ncbi:hypothetical protein PAXRUDRAFT_29320, partial [Paxillus rubicundulus Ve08.2h10]